MLIYIVIGFLNYISIFGLKYQPFIYYIIYYIIYHIIYYIIYFTLLCIIYFHLHTNKQPDILTDIHPTVLPNVHPDRTNIKPYKHPSLQPDISLRYSILYH